MDTTSGNSSGTLPDSPEEALACFRELANQGNTHETGNMAAALLERFGEEPDVLLAVGNWNKRAGRPDNAAHCFERSLELAPDDEIALRSLAMARVEQGRLDDAHRLLGGMLDPGPSQDRWLLRKLARAYQDADRHREAVQIFACILKGHAPTGQDKAFRQEVQTSEGQLEMPASILPKRELPTSITRTLPAAVALGLLAIVGAWLTSSYLSANQTLHVVNGLNQPFKVSVADGEAISVAPSSRRNMKIAEGQHTAKVRFADGKVLEIDFVVENSLFQRFCSDSVFVLNPRGAASLLREQVVFTTYGGNDKPGSELRFGEQFMTFRDIYYAFKPAPQSISTESSRVVRNQLTVIRERPVDVLDYFTDQRPERLMQFARHHLEVNPDDLDLLQVYLTLSATKPALLTRRNAFMKLQLAKRPILVEWHRVNQSLNQAPATYARLVAEYDALLAKKPKSAALLYLRSRLCASTKEAARYLDLAPPGSRGIGYVHMARAYHHNSQGRFGLALGQLVAATELKSSQRWQNAEYTTRFAAGQHQRLLKEMRRLERRSPMDKGLCTSIVELLVKQGDRAGARRAVDAYAKRVRAKFPGAEAEKALLECRLSLLLFLGEDAKILKACRKVKDTVARRDWMIRANMVVGNMAAAEKHAPKKPGEFNSHFGLGMYTGWFLAGKTQDADRWLKGSIRELKLGPPEECRLAELLEKESVSVEAALDAPQLPSDKATTLLALACRHPAIRKPLLDVVEKLNYSLFSPHNFRKRAIAELRKR